MSKKPEVRFVCGACGAVHAKWLGKCPGCGAWDSLSQEARVEVERRRDGAGRAAPVSSIQVDASPRLPTGIGELDRVLGGGAVPGSTVLVGGDPGVGKSTLLLAALAALADHGDVLYVTGEESAAQVASRARRLGLAKERLFVLAAGELGEVEAAARSTRPIAMVVDSVQTMRDAQVGSPAGTVTQLREVAQRLVEISQRAGIATFLVGHVTKEGALAGPKVLEHLVDVVLSFEGERGHAFRALRAAKNRFGAATEVGLFEMAGDGLREVTQPSALFLAERPRHAAGSVVAATSEGARALLVEVQALVGHPHAGSGRRSATGVDGQRLAMLLAVLGRRCELELGAADVFVNVAGGMRIEEPALDLAVAVAVASSFRGRPFPTDMAVLGEVGLAGEVRGVPRLVARLAEVRSMGFARAMLPWRAAERVAAGDHDGVALVPVRTVDDALSHLD